MTKSEADARCAYAACKCAQASVLAVRDSLSWKDGGANSELCRAESALNRLLLMLNNRIMEETEKRRKR